MFNVILREVDLFVEEVFEEVFEIIDSLRV